MRCCCGNLALDYGSRAWYCLFHVTASIQLTKVKSNARPVPYVRKDVVQATYASRAMMWSGPIVFAFIVYHLLHLTFGTVHPDFQELRPYENVVAAFQGANRLHCLYRRDGDTRISSVSRPVEHVPDAGRKSSDIFADAETRRRYRNGAADRRLYLGAHLGDGGSSPDVCLTRAFPPGLSKKSGTHADLR